jgi:hypothetical protein
MRNPIRAGHRDSAAAPVQELTIPAGRHPVPTQTRLHTRRVPVAMYVLALLVIPAMVVVGFMSAGLWATTGTSITAQAGTPAADGGTDGGAPAAPANPADVKGSMTVKEVIDAFPKITAAQILAQFGAPLSTPTSTQLKDLVEGGNGMDLPGVRTWLEKQAAG